MATLTTEPTAGNEIYTTVANAAAQLPLLNVGDLEVSNATTNFLSVASTAPDVANPLQNPSNTRFTIDSVGHLTSAQQVPPSLVAVFAAPATLTGLANNTDVCGTVRLTTTAAPGVGEGIQITYNRPYQNAPEVFVQVADPTFFTAANPYVVQSFPDRFRILFPLGTAVNISNQFKYFVIDKVAI